MDDPSPPDSSAPNLAAIEAEVGQLREQVKLMVRTESKLHKIQNTLDHQIKIFSKLHELGVKITMGFEVKDITAQVATFATYDLGYERCIVLLDHPKQNALRVFGFDGYYGDDWPKRLEALRLGAGDPLPMALKHKRKLLHVGVGASASAAETLPPEGIADFANGIELDELLAFPIFREGELIGAVVAGNSAENKANYVSVTDENAMTGMANLAAQAGSALSSAISHSELEGERNLLEERVNERTGELGTALQKLKELDTAKSQFFANVSHELRTPLTLSLAPLEEILHHADRVSEVDHNRYLKVVYNNQLRLLKLINNLLDFAKLDAGQMTGSFQEMDLVEALRFYVGTVSAAAETRKIVLSIDTELPKVRLFLDRDKLEKIVMNLLSNAFKFTPDGGAITISVRDKDDEHVELVVADSGIGIPPESIDKLFQRFMQVDASLKRRYEGTGIGLAMVKDYVAIHGGEIRVQSVVGKGSRFIISFVKGVAHLPQDAIIVAEPDEQMKAIGAHQFADFRTDEDEEERDGEVMSEDEDDPIVVDDATTQTDVVAAEATEAMAGVLESVGSIQIEGSRVLVVDDVPDMRKFVSRVLRGGKYQVREARDGMEGLELAQRMKPDLIVSDVMMPRMTGYELTAAIRKNPELARTPIILLSAKGDLEGKLAGLEHGADDYLTKPFNADELMTRARNLLRLRVQEKRLFETQARLHAAERAAVEGEIALARRVQASILPSAPDFHSAGVALSGFLVGATECSGDFWMYRQLPDDRVLVVLADVTGHGLASAMLTELAYGALNAIVRSGKHLTPSYILHEVNAIVGDSPIWIALAVAILDPKNRTSTWGNAAQPPIIVQREGEQPVFVRSTHAPLGGSATAEYTDIEVSLEGNPRFLLYSDGLVEATAAPGTTKGRQEFGLKRLISTHAPHTQPRPALDAIRTKLESFCGTTVFADDVTMVAITT